MAEFQETKARVVNVEAPYFIPQLIGVHFLDEDVPHNILSAIGVADNDIESWTVYGASPSPGFIPQETDIVVDIAGITKRTEGRHLDDFRRAAAGIILTDMLHKVVSIDIDDGAFAGRHSFTEGAVCGLAASLLLKQQHTDLGMLALFVPPVVGGLLAPLVPSRKRAMRKRATELADKLNTEHPELIVDLYQTILPQYNIPK